MLDSVTLDLNPVDRGIVGELGPRRRLGQEGPPTRVAQGGLVTPLGCTLALYLCKFSAERHVGWQMRPLPRPRLTGETLVDVSFDRVRTLIGPHSPDHETEAMPESSSHRQTNTASHEIIGNFMTKMTELLEATLANRRGERAQSTSNDEALERFLRF
ncbi:hypothetical protein M9H77_34484 [Catharanthus roseus]|uniref:Uncharacterized protein n=1 Tax=Catharanthus roseus TaxID=4058 RepID=A0ACB9ZN12_CATRO|nr:hypothetical protein M9H77_34484 [Catharanthus roseus]